MRTLMHRRMEDEEADIIRVKLHRCDFLNYTPELRDSPTVQDALKTGLKDISIKEVNDRGRQEAKDTDACAGILISYLMILTLFEYRDLVPGQGSTGSNDCK